MDIGIIGSGRIGSILARRLAALGHQVRIANSRGPESLAALAAETEATASTVEQAASARDVVIVTIPQKAVPELPRGLFAVSTAVVVDTGNYYPARDGRIDAIDEGLTDSEWVAQVLGRPVVKAFNNILAASLDSRGTPEGTPGRVCLSVAGDDSLLSRGSRAGDHLTPEDWHNGFRTQTGQNINVAANGIAKLLRMMIEEDD